ncbi:hypothetical protein ACOMHN_031441 [Nucella lapillus]
MMTVRKASTLLWLDSMVKDYVGPAMQHGPIPRLPWTCRGRAVDVPWTCRGRAVAYWPAPLTDAACHAAS